MIKHVWFDVAGTLYPETPEFNAVHDQLRYDTYAALVGQTDPLKSKQEYEQLYAKHGSNSAVFKALGMVTCLLWEPSEVADYSATTFSDLVGIVEAAVQS
jgi:FMN phosphatase YigB (HAD superfamily)